MFRTAILRSARAATPRTISRPLAIARPVATRFTPTIFQAVRCYSAAAGLSKTEVEGRIVDLMKQFDKVITLPWLDELEVLRLIIVTGYRSIKGIFAHARITPNPYLTGLL